MPITTITIAPSNAPLPSNMVFFSWFVVVDDHQYGDFLLKFKVTDTGHHTDYKHIFYSIYRAFPTSDSGSLHAARRIKAGTIDVSFLASSGIVPHALIYGLSGGGFSGYKQGREGRDESGRVTCRPLSGGNLLPADAGRNARRRPLLFPADAVENARARGAGLSGLLELSNSTMLN